MQVAVLRVEVHVPESRSLKSKRAVVRPVVEGARHRFAVAAAEVDHQDTWQRAAFGFAVVASTERHCVEVLDAVERFVWAQPGLEVLCCQRSWLDADA